MWVDDFQNIQGKSKHDLWKQMKIISEWTTSNILNLYWELFKQMDPT